MTTPQPDPDVLALRVQDYAYHQARVLLLVVAVVNKLGKRGALDGLTKLAKLDFLVRYPLLASVALRLPPDEVERLSISNEDKLEVESPMIRHKYGPWDDRYYPVLGGLIGKGLIEYVPKRRGNVSVRPTKLGRNMAEQLAGSDAWREIAQRCAVIAGAAAGLTGNNLKELIYDRLPEVVDRPHREVIRA